MYRKKSAKTARIIDVSKVDDMKIETKIKQDSALQERVIISVGFNIIKVVHKMDCAFASMISNTYFICMIAATSNLYVSSSAIFYRGKYEVYLLSVAGLSVAWLAIFRVYIEAKSGHHLGKLMKKCSYHLDRYSFSEHNMNSGEVQLLREEFQNHCEAPIAPYSAFTLSTSSLLGFSGTIITYIIVLLQFRTS